MLLLDMSDSIVTSGNLKLFPGIAIQVRQLGGDAVSHAEAN